MLFNAGLPPRIKFAGTTSFPGSFPWLGGAAREKTLGTRLFAGTHLYTWAERGTVIVKVQLNGLVLMSSGLPKHGMCLIN